MIKRHKKSAGMIIPDSQLDDTNLNPISLQEIGEACSLSKDTECIY